MTPYFTKHGYGGVIRRLMDINRITELLIKHQDDLPFDAITTHQRREKRAIEELMTGWVTLVSAVGWWASSCGYCHETVRIMLEKIQGLLTELGECYQDQADDLQQFADCHKNLLINLKECLKNE